MNGVSIVICCFNSSARLSETLKHLAQQKVLNNISWEIIIVNNNSTDDTKEVACDEWGKYNLKDVQFTIVDEHTPGLSSARERGVQVSKFEYIIFCDDDNWLDESYIQTVYDFMETNHHYAAIGGESHAAFEERTEVPAWFTEYKQDYAVGVQGKEGDITPRGYLWGAGIAFRKSVYKTVINSQFPSLLSDRKGIKLSSGGDYEMCLRFIIIGYRLYYSTSLKFKHFIPSGRLTIEYRDKLYNGHVESFHFLNKYLFFLNVKNSQGLCVKKVKIFFKYWLNFFKLRKLTQVDKVLLCVLTPYKVANFDDDYQLIQRLKILGENQSHKLHNLNSTV